MIDSAPGAMHRRRAIYAEALPIVTAAAAALASLAFFRPWVVISAKINAPSLLEGGPSIFEMSGAALAGEGDSWVPWSYVTPIALVLILAVSCLRVFLQNGPVRVIYGMALPALAIPILVWPAAALARVTHNLTHMQIGGALVLRGWWWIYCLALGAIMVSGIADLVRGHHARLR